MTSAFQGWSRKWDDKEKEENEVVITMTIVITPNVNPYLHTHNCWF